MMGDPRIIMTPSKEDHHSLVMPSSQYAEWLEIIRADDSEALCEILDNGSSIDKALLLYGRFEYEQLVTSTKSEVFTITVKNFQRPFILAAALLSRKCLKVFWEHKVNITLDELSSVNILHAICWAAFGLYPDRVDEYVQLIKDISTSFPLKDVTYLFHQENEFHLRPLELASMMQQYKIMDVMLRVDGVYRFPVENLGVYSAVLYDVTGYEFGQFGNRTDRSPLVCIANVTAETFAQKPSLDFFMSPLIQKWLKIRSDQFFGLLMLWFISRIMYIINYAFIGGELVRVELADEYFRNSMARLTGRNSCDVIGNGITQVLDDNNAPAFPLYTGLVAVCLILIFDMFDFGRYCVRRLKKSSAYRIKCAASRKRSALVENHTFRMMMTLQAIFTLAIVIYVQLGSKDDIETWMAEPRQVFEGIIMFLYGFALVINFWSIMFFMQLSQMMGHFVIAYSKMIGQMMRFLILYTLISLSFAHAFYSLAGMTCLPTIATFGSYMENWYNTFLISLNIFTLPKLPGKSLMLAYQATHIIYVFVVAVLMINFLVAIMANAVSLISGTESVINMLTKLSVYQIIHQRLGWLMSRVLPFFYYRFYVQKNGRLYILCYEKNSSNEKQRKLGSDGLTVKVIAGPRMRRLSLYHGNQVEPKM